MEGLEIISTDTTPAPDPSLFNNDDFPEDIPF